MARCYHGGEELDPKAGRYGTFLEAEQNGPRMRTPEPTVVCTLGQAKALGVILEKWEANAYGLGSQKNESRLREG